MIYVIGIALGVITAVLKGIDTVMNRSLMKDVSAIEHSLYRIIFVTPMLLLAALLHWRFEAFAIGWVFLYGLLEAANILLHQFAIKQINPVHAEILSKSKSLTTYLLSLFLVVESASVKGFLAIILFTIGLVITIDFGSMKKDHFYNIRGYAAELGSVLARTVKPFVLYKIVVSGAISNEALAVLSMPIAFTCIWIAFRPKLTFANIPIKTYFAQAVVVGAAMLTMGYAVIFAGAVMTAMTENLSMIVVALLMLFVYREKIPLRVWFGTTIAICAIILISI